MPHSIFKSKNPRPQRNCGRPGSAEQSSRSRQPSTTTRALRTTSSHLLMNRKVTQRPIDGQAGKSLTDRRQKRSLPSLCRKERNRHRSCFPLEDIEIVIPKENGRVKKRILFVDDEP